MAVTGLKKPDEMELQAWLKSGVVLCNLANCLKPGLVAKVSEVQKPFNQMENISAYLEACREYGVPVQDKTSSPSTSSKARTWAPSCATCIRSAASRRRTASRAPRSARGSRHPTGAPSSRSSRPSQDARATQAWAW